MLMEQKLPVLCGLWTRILNRVLRRTCKRCKYWCDWHYACTGTCNRTPFHPLCTEYSWQKACEYYEEGGAK